MGTRAFIAVRHDDGTLRSIQLCYDGGVDAAARLSSCYGTRAQAADLLSIGDLRVLAPRIDLCETSDAHDGRACEPVVHADLDDLMDSLPTFCNHVHVFEGGRWVHHDLTTAY